MGTNGNKKKKNILKNFFLIAILASIILFAFFIFARTDNKNPETEIPDTSQEEQKTDESPIVITEEIKAPPASALLKVPYTVQAPDYSWVIHDESCEEAATLMYHYFLTPKLASTKIIPAATASQEFIKMKSWQKSHYGKEPDLSIKKLGAFIQEYYGHRYRTQSKVTINDIKREIAVGNPVIVPVMTHSLGNPNYGRENSYHVLMIKGYNTKGIITNDAGISKGRDYFYTWKILFRAIDDQSERMNQGREMLVITR
jgi:hypothetical protein